MIIIIQIKTCLRLIYWKMCKIFICLLINSSTSETKFNIDIYRNRSLKLTRFVRFLKKFSKKNCDLISQFICQIRLYSLGLDPFYSFLSTVPDFLFQSIMHAQSHLQAYPLQFR